MRLAFVVAAALLLLAACGSGEREKPRPESLPASALPDLESRGRPLDAESLAADSLDPEALTDVLGRAGFVAGSEREFAGKTRTFDHVVARTLVFRSAAGAETYLGWLRDHAADFLGRAEATDVSTPGRSAVAFSLAQCGSCKKEVPTFLAGWRRGATVMTLLAGGSGANPDRFSALARRFDATVES